jgi:hypothetical protein
VVRLSQPYARLSVHGEHPPLSYLSPPASFCSIAEQDLFKATSAVLRMQTFGVNGDQYASAMHFNGAAIGTAPTTGADAWRDATVTLPAAARTRRGPSVGRACRKRSWLAGPRHFSL